MNVYLLVARQVCSTEAQARVIALMMQEQDLPVSPVTAMLLMDHTLVIADKKHDEDFVVPHERYEL